MQDLKENKGLQIDFSLVNPIQEPQLKCKCCQDNDLVCTNKECKKSAFHCYNKKCENFQAHILCSRVCFGTYTHLIRGRHGLHSSFLEKIKQIDDEMIAVIRKSSEELASQISFGDLEDRYTQIINKIYCKREVDNFSGKEMEDLYSRLKEVNNGSKERESDLQKAYKDRMVRWVEEGAKLKREILKDYLNSKEQPNNSSHEPNIQFKPFIDSPLIKNCLATMYSNSNSNTGKGIFEKEHIEYLLKELYNAKSAQLIFTASQHNFKAAAFHQKCDGVDNTLTVVRTEFGKTIFAFAAQKWGSAGVYVNDPSGRSCIILLDQKKKCGIVNAGSSIHCYPSYGPTFGGGHDICIYDDCHINNKSWCNFPSSYNNGFTNSQQSYTAICGAPSGYNFKVVDYEVFKLIFQ